MKSCGTKCWLDMFKEARTFFVSTHLKLFNVSRFFFHKCHLFLPFSIIKAISLDLVMLGTTKPQKPSKTHQHTPQKPSKHTKKQNHKNHQDTHKKKTNPTHNLKPSKTPNHRGPPSNPLGAPSQAIKGDETTLHHHVDKEPAERHRSKTEKNKQEKTPKK